MGAELSDRRLAVNPIYIPLRLSENAFELRVGPFMDAKHSITDSEGEGVIGDLVEYLDGSYTVAEILDRFDDEYRTEIRSILETLYEERALVDVSEREPDSLWSYSVIDDEISADQHDRLREATVGVVTRGRIGTMVASDLTATGVESVRVKSIGDGRELAADSSVTRESGDIETLVSSVDYVVYADDSPGTEIARQVNRAAVESETPMTAGQLLGVEGILGPTVVPGQSPCLKCLLSRWRGYQSDVESYEAYTASSHELGDVHLPAHSRILSGLLSKEATTQLLTGHGYVVGRTLDIELRSMAFETNELLKRPRCSICGIEHEDEQRLVNRDLLKYTHD